MTKAFDNFYTVTFWTFQSNKNYSTPKVRTDICSILRNEGVHVIDINPSDINSFQKELALHCRNASSTGKKLNTIIQYPLKPVLNITNEDSNLPYDVLNIINSISDHKIVIAHDIKSIQSSMFGKTLGDSQVLKTNNFERKLFTEADSLIVHSNPMKGYMASSFGISNEQIQCLELFDYISFPVFPAPKKHTGINIGFAGYLGIAKKKLLDQLFCNLPILSNVTYNMYGPDFPEHLFQREDIRYHGSIDPNLLPQIMNNDNDYGLLWDEFNPLQRKYYKMIAPHKCSLYIRSMLPLIVPSNTYIGDFVETNQIGITINNLGDICSINNPKINFENLTDLQKKVSSGYFTLRAVAKSLQP